MQMDSYLKPSYDMFANGTKLQFYARLSDLISRMRLIQMVLISITAATFVLLVTYVFYKIKIYKEKMR